MFLAVSEFLTNEAKCTPELKSTFAMVETVCNRKTLFTSKWDFNLRKKIGKCYILSIALHGAETWTLWRVDQKYLEKFKSGAGEGWR